MAGLVIMRKKGEAFLLGDDIKITAIDCRQGSVRLHIDAPIQLRIVREELLDDEAMREKRLTAVENLKRELAAAEFKLGLVTVLPIQSDLDDVDDLGRRLLDEAANGFVAPGACVIDDEV